MMSSALQADELQGYVDDPLLNSPFALVSTVNIALTYMIWYVVVTHWSLSNYVSWVRYNEALLGNYPNPRIYLAFVVLSEVGLWLLCGPLLFYAAKYRKSNKDRNRMLGLAIAVMFILSDVPLFIMDISIVYYYNFQSVVQTVTLILRGMSFFAALLITWQMYVHRMVKFLHNNYDDSEEQVRVRERLKREADRRARGIRGSQRKLEAVAR